MPELSRLSICQVWSAASWDVPLLTAATYCGLGFSINQDPKLGAPWELSGVEDDEAFLINISELPNDSLSKSRFLCIDVYLSAPAD